jgi:hypothetical protein
MGRVEEFKFPEGKIHYRPVGYNISVMDYPERMILEEVDDIEIEAHE